MPQWNKDQPQTLMELTQGILEGDKPEVLKLGADEYGRLPYMRREAADVRATQAQALTPLTINHAATLRLDELNRLSEGGAP